MSPGQRGDEIIRLLDEALGEQATVPAGTHRPPPSEAEENDRDPARW